MATSSGKYAKAISDRSGLEFPYTEMVKEWNGMTVHRSEFETRHPQDEQNTTHRADSEALSNSKPERTEPIEVLVGNKTFFDQNNTMQPLLQEILIMRMSINPVTVSTS
tara:strand:+ start:699 stop:1025 length:327 start_codon:yes stop_codon:yes gene_type:complete